MLRKSTLHGTISVTQKSRSDDILQIAATVANLAKEISNMAACPPAAAAISVVQSILETVQKVKTNQEACMRLAQRCTRILIDINSQMQDRWDSAPTTLIKNLEKFRETLVTIHQYMTLQMNVNWLKRFSKKGTIELTLDELDGLLTDAGQNFQMSALINIHYAVSSSHPSKNTNTPNVAKDQASSATGSRLSDISLSRSARVLPLPVDPEYCLSYHEKPQYHFHDYIRPAPLCMTETYSQTHFLEYLLTDVRAETPSVPLVTEVGWWSGTTEAVIEGQVVLVKRYDKLNGYESWFRDVELLRKLFHPNIPQILGHSVIDSPVPFILLDNVFEVRSPRDVNLHHLLSTSVHSCTQLILKFYHELKDVSSYFKESLSLIPAQVQAILEDIPIGVDKSNSIIVGLPLSSDGHAVTYHNHELLYTLKTICMNMLPRVPLEKETHGTCNRDEASLESLLYELVSSVRKLLMSHYGPTRQKYTTDEECSCNDPNPYLYPESRTWMAYTPVEAPTFMAWDFGYIPEGKGVEAFIRLGNAIKDELVDFPVEESASGVQWMCGHDSEYSHDLPYLSLADRVACWTLEVPRNTQVLGEVVHQAQVAEEDAWRFLLTSGKHLAEEFSIRLQDIRIITRIEKKLDFDIFYYDHNSLLGQPPSTMYLLTCMERLSYLSATPTRGPPGSTAPELGIDWICSIKVRSGPVHSVAVTAPYGRHILSSSPEPEETGGSA